MHRFAPTVDLLTGMAIGAVAAGCTAGANQPNMQAALNALQGAGADVIQATPNKGGRRERAINFVDTAIAETQAGIACAGN